MWSNVSCRSMDNPVPPATLTKRTAWSSMPPPRTVFDAASSRAAAVVRLHCCALVMHRDASPDWSPPPPTHTMKRITGLVPVSENIHLQRDFLQISTIRAYFLKAVRSITTPPPLPVPLLLGAHQKTLNLGSLVNSIVLQGRPVRLRENEPKTK